MAMLAAANARSAAAALISIADLAERLGVSVRTIRRGRFWKKLRRG
jgi:hypothetical protein